MKDRLFRLIPLLSLTSALTAPVLLGQFSPQQQKEAEVRANLDKLKAGIQQTGMATVLWERQSRLNQGVPQDWNTDFEAGFEYGVVGLCDRNCGNLLLVLTDAWGQEVARHTQGNSAHVEVRTQSKQTYKVTASMGTCTLQPCEYGLLWVRTALPVTPGGSPPPIAAPLAPSAPDLLTPFAGITAPVKYLTWSSPQGATSFDVFLGTTNPPPALEFGRTAPNLPINLRPGTYYWRVVAKNGGGATSSLVSSFTVPSPRASYPNRAAEVPRLVSDLSQSMQRDYAIVNTKTGELDPRQVYSFSLGRLDVGAEYFISGLCDSACRVMDLVLMDARGQEVEWATGDAKPRLAITPRVAQEYSLRVKMTDCGASPCYWAVVGGRQQLRPTPPPAPSAAIRTATLQPPVVTWQPSGSEVTFQVRGLVRNAEGSTAQALVYFTAWDGTEWKEMDADPRWPQFQNFRKKVKVAQNFVIPSGSFNVSFDLKIPYEAFNLPKTGGVTTYQLRGQAWLEVGGLYLATSKPVDFTLQW